MAGRCSMKKLRDGVEDYLALRRGLGFKLKRHGRFAREFAAAMEKRGETRITTRSAIEWATDPQHLHTSEWAARLSSVRTFARYWSTIDTSTEIPPDGLLPFRPVARNHTCTQMKRSDNSSTLQKACRHSSRCIGQRITAFSVFWQ